MRDDKCVEHGPVVRPEVAGSLAQPLRRAARGSQQPFRALSEPDPAYAPQELARYYAQLATTWQDRAAREHAAQQAYERACCVVATRAARPVAPKTQGIARWIIGFVAVVGLAVVLLQIDPIDAGVRRILELALAGRVD